MDTGNELYSVLSRLYNQDFLLLTELPQMVTVLETNFMMILFKACVYLSQSKNLNLEFGLLWKTVQVILVIYMMFHPQWIFFTVCP